ncbi:GPI transamidase subunit PIG-U, partial [Piptocephalis cylindrospora]
LAGAALVRLLLLFVVSSSLWETVANHVLVVNPLTRWKPLAEGAFLLEHGMSPYDGGPCHQPPLLLTLATLLSRFPLGIINAYYLFLDLLAGFLLYQVGEAATSKGITPKPNGYHLGLVMMSVYLFNPISLITSMARSSLIYTHLAILSSLLYALRGSRTWAMCSIALATYLSLYPLVLITPILLALTHQVPASSRKDVMLSCIGGVLAWTSALHLLSFLLTASWDYLPATYGFILSIPDLTPNVGLWWYYLTEMFESFRVFFIGALQLHLFAFAIPVAIRFSDRPDFAFWLLLGIGNAFKGYPSIGDITVTLALLPLFHGVFAHMRYSFLISSLFLHALALSLPFWHLWIHWGSGNANFFFAVTLVWAAAQIILLVDVVYGMLRVEFSRKWP